MVHSNPPFGVQIIFIHHLAFHALPFVSSPLASLELRITAILKSFVLLFTVFVIAWGPAGTHMGLYAAVTKICVSTYLNRWPF